MTAPPSTEPQPSAVQTGWRLERRLNDLGNRLDGARRLRVNRMRVRGLRDGAAEVP